MKYLYAIAEAPNGATVNIHRLHQVTLEKHRVLITLNHYANAEQELPTWQDQYEMPLEEFQLGSYPDCIWDWISSPTGLFPSGQILNDPTSLEDARKIKRHQIERARDGHIFGGFTFQPYGKFQTDPRSIDNIKSAISAATIAKAFNKPFGGRWRLDDDSFINIDPDVVIDAGLTILAYATAVYERSWALKDLVDAAETAEEVEAIALDGWPVASN